MLNDGGGWSVSLQVADYVQEIKQQLVNLSSSHAATFVRIEAVKVKYDRIMRQYVQNLKVNPRKGMDLVVNFESRCLHNWMNNPQLCV